LQIIVDEHQVIPPSRSIDYLLEVEHRQLSALVDSVEKVPSSSTQ